MHKITSYTVYANPNNKYYWVRLKLATTPVQTTDVRLHTLPDLQAFVDLLRNERNVMFDPETENVVVAWEPTGDNDPY